MSKQRVEHDVWEGADFEKGIAGRRLIIVGHSHYTHEAVHTVDTPEFTRKVVGPVVAGTCRVPFFTAIAGYFGYEPEVFWARVAFFNFIPNLIGSVDQRSSKGTPEQISAGHARAIRILNALRPDLVFVFSQAAWTEFPPTVEEENRTQDLPPGPLRSFRLNDGSTIGICGMRHPLGAPKGKMKDLVTRVMACP